MPVRLCLVLDLELEDGRDSVNPVAPRVALAAAASALQAFAFTAAVHPVRVEVDGDVELYSRAGEPV